MHKENLNKAKIRLVSLVSFIFGFLDAFFIYVLSSYFSSISGSDNVGGFYLAAYGAVLLCLFSLQPLIRKIGRSRTLSLSLGIAICAAAVLASAGSIWILIGAALALIVATNVNDILHRALTTGDYSAGTVTPTAAPSMDIQVSSNFERLLFDLNGRDGAALAQQMAGFEQTRAMQLTNAQREGAAALFTSARADADAMTRALRWAWEQTGELLDPHTAIGIHAAQQAGLDPAVPVVTLATAHPAKFGEAVERATGQHPVLPTRVGDLFDREERLVELPGDYAAVADYVAARAVPRG